MKERTFFIYTTIYKTTIVGKIPTFLFWNINEELDDLVELNEGLLKTFKLTFNVKKD